MSTTTNQKIISIIKRFAFLAVIAISVVVAVKLLNPTTTPPVKPATTSAVINEVKDNKPKTTDKILGTRFNTSEFLACYIPYLFLTCLMAISPLSDGGRLINYIMYVYGLGVFITDIVHATGDEKVRHPFYMTLILFLTSWIIISVRLIPVIISMVNKIQENEFSLLDSKGNIREKHKKWTNELIN